jgi:hypothetical protein
MKRPRREVARAGAFCCPKSRWLQSGGGNHSSRISGKFELMLMDRTVPNADSRRAKALSNAQCKQHNSADPDNQHRKRN